MNHHCFTCWRCEKLQLPWEEADNGECIACTEKPTKHIIWKFLHWLERLIWTR